MYGKQTEWETWGSGHLRSREEEVDTLKDLLPAGCELSKNHVKTIKGKLPLRLDKVYPRWHWFVRVRCSHLNRARTDARAHCAFVVSTKSCVGFLLLALRSWSRTGQFCFSILWSLHCIVCPVSGRHHLAVVPINLCAWFDVNSALPFFR